MSGRRSYAFVGLGHLGGNLAASLLRNGFAVTVYDRDPDAVARLVALGASAATSPAEAAARAGNAVTCLPSPAVSEAVLTGPEGLLAGLPSGGTWIEMSTNGREEIIRLAALASEKGVKTLECPVTGGVHLAQAYHAICASSGASFVHETESQLVLNGSYDIGFTMDLALKDLGFAVGMGEKFGVPLDLATRVNAIFEAGKAAYGGDAWSTMIVKLLEDQVGTDLRAPGFPARL